MIRYSMVLHEVRQHFALSLYEYVVCDSIHQVSHAKPSYKTDAEIAEFIGLDRSTVSKIRRKLIERGLVAEIDRGIQTTQAWASVVTYVKSDPSSYSGIKSPQGDSIPKTGIVSPHTSINKDNKYRNASAFRIEADTEDPPSRQAKTKKVTPGMQEVFDLFAQNPARLVWRTRTHEREAAQVLFDTYGIEVLKKRYRIMQKYRSDPMCPQVDSPSEFLTKMPKMERFLNNL